MRAASMTFLSTVVLYLNDIDYISVYLVLFSTIVTCIVGTLVLHCIERLYQRWTAIAPESDMEYAKAPSPLFISSAGSEGGGKIDSSHAIPPESLKSTEIWHRSKVTIPASSANLLSSSIYVFRKEAESLATLRRSKTADKIPTLRIQDRLKNEEVEASSISLYSQDKAIQAGEDPPWLKEQGCDRHQMQHYGCFEVIKGAFPNDEPDPESSEPLGISQASPSASPTLMNRSSLSTPYTALVREPKTTPVAVLYLVLLETQQAVTAFLQDYAGISSIAPYALLMVDASISNFTGCVLTALCLNPRGENSMREAEEGQRALPLRIDTAMLTGESVLIPQNHDPWVFMQCLLDERLVRLAAVQPQVSRSNRVQREYDRGAKSYERFVLDSGAESIVEEAQILALEKLGNPTMAKFDWRQGDLIWAGWDLLLEDVLRSEWDEKVRRLIGEFREEGQECTEGKCVMVCHSVKMFKQQWLLAEVMASVEGQYTGPAVGVKQCKRLKWKNLQQYGMA